MKRCKWVKANHPLYVAYHDTEWGVPVYDDQKLFEFIVLESAQAGLSWEIILNKREGYRAVFKNFDPLEVSKMSENDVARLLKSPNIVRNQLKIRATISNAKIFIAIQKEFGSFATFLWSFVNNQQMIRKSDTSLPAQTDISTELSKNLKQRGFKFFGPVVSYAFMQAVGLVNDHDDDCFRFNQV